MHDWTPGQWFRATDSIKINDADREEPLYLHPNRPLQVGRIDGDALFFTVSDGSEWGVFAGDPNLEAIAEHLVPLCELGVRWGTGYGDNKERLSTFKLPLTPEQWVNVCDKEGRWLGVCCGNISSMRDIMISTLRESGWISSEDLTELVGLMRSHDGFMERWEDGYDESQDDPNDPFLLITKLWEAAKDHLEVRDDSRGLDLANDLDDAITGLARGTRALDWRFFFSAKPDQYTAETYPTLSEEELEQRRKAAVYENCLTMHSTLLRFLPCLHTIHTKIEELYPEPLEGVAAVLTQTWRWEEDEETGKREKVTVYKTDRWGHGIVMIRSGLGIFPDHDALERAIEVWEASDPEIRSKVKVVPVTITVERGIELHEAP